MFHGKLRPRQKAYILNNISSADTDEVNKEEMAKNQPLSKNTWYGWLFKYNLDPIKDKGIVLGKTLWVSLKKIKNYK